MLGGGLQLHEIDDVDHADPQLGQMLAQDRDRRQRLERRDIAGAGHDEVRLAVLSLLAHCQMPMPSLQCATAASIDSHCGAGCLPATTTLT